MTPTISDALPRDIYADPAGTLWRIATVGPVIEADEVEGVSARQAAADDPGWIGWQRVVRWVG